MAVDFEDVKKKARARVEERHPAPEAPAVATPEEKPHAAPKYAYDLGQPKPENEQGPHWGSKWLAIAGFVGGAVATMGLGVPAMLVGMAAGAGGGHLIGKHVVDPHVSKPIAGVGNSVKESGKSMFAAMGDAVGAVGKPLIALGTGLAVAGAAAVGLLPAAAPAVAGLVAGGVSLAATAGRQNTGVGKGAVLGMAVAAVPALAMGVLTGINVSGLAEFGIFEPFTRSPSPALQTALSSISELGVAAKMTAVGAGIIAAGGAVGATIGGAVHRVHKIQDTVFRHGPADWPANALHGIKDTLVDPPAPKTSDIRVPERASGKSWTQKINEERAAGPGKGREHG